MTPGLLEQVMGGDFKTEWETAQAGLQIKCWFHRQSVSNRHCEGLSICKLVQG